MINFNSIKLPAIKKFIIYSFCMIILAIISYYYIDAPVARWAYDNSRISPFHPLWLNATHLQPIYFIASPWVFIYFAVRVLLNKSLKPSHIKLIVALVCMGITVILNEELRYIFGRHWPSTWYYGNLSLINHGAYGFTWFTSNHGYHSFPSGHTACIFGLMMPIIWLFDNIKIKLFALVNCLIVPLGLILMCYHFVSDIVIGSFVGTIVSYLILYALKKREFNARK